MIVSHIIGGLGNQMFQYAAGRALSLARGVPLRLDVSDFEGYGLHQGFELTRLFACSPTIADSDDVRAMLGWQAAKRIRRVVARPQLRFLRNRHFVLEPHLHYWQGIREVKSPAYLMGYWQSEKYFLAVAAQIREDFAFKLPLSRVNAELANQISQVSAVSLHVRRGDYVSNPKATAMHGLCSLAYYQAAIQYVAERVTNPVFFVFSDDAAWVKVNLKMDYPCQYVEHNQGTESYNDMRLMSLCQHHIVANSSFSWWGAWLNPNPEKIVVAPVNWFNNTVVNAADLIPAEWVRL
jgi:hypothetical protein